MVCQPSKPENPSQLVILECKSEYEVAISSEVLGGRLKAEATEYPADVGGKCQPVFEGRNPA